MLPQYARMRRRARPSAALAFTILLLATALARGQGFTPVNFKIAFIGDQGLGPNSVAVLNLIKNEGAQAVVHSGDLDYEDDPAAWDAQINGVLGPGFPYFASIGNHDDAIWTGPGGYQQFLVERFNRLGIIWEGDLGVRSSFHYNGIFFVLTAPGITGFDTGDSDIYIRDELAADASVWSVCSWHKNMSLMQAGGKSDETGWGVYEESRRGGAIIATGHEHSYSRTHLLSDMMNQTIASASNTLTISKGRTFAFVSGLGGRSIRDQELGGAWWARIYAATCLAGDAACTPGANYGALFGVFNLNGEPDRATFYFKDIDGRVIDSFDVVSDVETLAGFEADVSPRPGGDNDGTVTMADWVQLGRFASKLDAAIDGSEFQRSDCAPLSTRGDGNISVADWVQAARFAAGLDPVVPAAGPTSPPTGTAFQITPVQGGPFDTHGLGWPALNLFNFDDANRAVRVLPAESANGRRISVDVELDARGDESGLGFTLAFDPARLRFVGARAGDGAPGATLNVNAARRGRVGLSLALPSGVAFERGSRRVITLSFIHKNVGRRDFDGDEIFDLADSPVAREVVSVRAERLAARFLSGRHANAPSLAGGPTSRGRVLR